LHSSPYLFPLLFTGLIALSVAIIAVRRWRAPGATPIAALMLGVLLWCIGDALYYSMGHTSAWLLATFITHAGVGIVPAALLVYSLRITARDHLLRRRHIALLAIEPVLALVLLSTNPWHHQFYSAYAANFNGQFYEPVVTHGPLFFIQTAYSYTLVTISLVLLVIKLFRTRRAYNGQLLASVAALLIPWVGNIMYTFGLYPWKYLDVTPFLFAFTGLALLFGLFRYQLFEISPVARDRMIEVMSDGVVVLDTLDRIVDLNPAFERMTGLQAGRLIGAPIHSLIHQWPEPVICPEKAAGSEDTEFHGEISLPAGPDGTPISYDIKLSRLYQRRGQLLGRVVVLRDITEQKRILAAEQQQRSIAEALIRSGQMLASSLELDTVLDSLLDQVTELVPYDSATLILLREGRAYIARTRGFEKYGPDAMRMFEPIVFQLDKTANLYYMARHKQPLNIPDTHADPNWIHLPVTQFIRSWIGAPMVVRDQVIGFFSFDKAEPNFYTAVHLERIAAFAGQAALSLENARLYAETRESLERERRLNEMIGMISSSLSLEETLPKVVRLACELIGGDMGTLALVDDRTNRMFPPVVYNVPECVSVDGQPQGHGIAWQLVKTGRPVLAADYSHLPNARKTWVEMGVKGFVGVPVIAGQQAIGGLGVYSFRFNAFTQRDLAVIESVAAQAAVAIQNARLFMAAQRRAEEAENLREATAAVTHALDLNQVLDRILIHLENVVPYDSATVFLLEDDSLKVQAGRGFKNPDRLFDARFPIDNDLFIEAARTGQYVLLSDAQYEPRFKKWGDSAHVRGWMGLPLVARGQVIGLLTVDSSQPNAFVESDARLAQALANEAATAIGNAHLFAEVQRMAITDPLTGLFNRRQFFELARREFERSLRYGAQVALMMLDIDNLKAVNDSHGHLAGDLLVDLVARSLESLLRRVDILSRYAGDEFIVLMPETNLAGAMSAAERVRELIALTPVAYNAVTLHTSTSIGVAELTPDCHTLETLVDRADQALYVSKRLGKNHVAAWQPSLAAKQAGEAA
jgi:diguanylate cyclase (GGDEF)-like protein/PAS domain S-box-containing protein